nr:10535_t:CDS:2 [Entrophospora candida]
MSHENLLSIDKEQFVNEIYAEIVNNAISITNDTVVIVMDVNNDGLLSTPETNVGKQTFWIALNARFEAQSAEFHLFALWINRTWYKEVKHELHIRREKFKNQYWRTVSVRYMEIQLKEEGKRFSNYMGTDDCKKHNDKMKFLDGKCNESFYKLVEVEGCMLRNKLIRKRERGDVLNRINHVNKSGWLHLWLEYEIEEMINPIDYELNILSIKSKLFIFK